ncbi:MAG: hypothetical protein JOS17DRAFT_751497 [Linnemannia elongata]|nr:MAG: hypothetical protein JOS17DRAFT_751497 [Linnemannia elongata]
MTLTFLYHTFTPLLIVDRGSGKAIFHFSCGGAILSSLPQYIVFLVWLGWVSGQLFPVHDSFLFISDKIIDSAMTAMYASVSIFFSFPYQAYNVSNNRCSCCKFF